MKCPKCHVNISNTAKYCPRCGKLFDNGDVEKLGNTLERSLLDHYLNRYKNSSRKFSWGYFFFNFIYLFYRKMYKHGIISGISTFILLKMLEGGFEIFLNSMGFYFLLVVYLTVGTLIVNIYYLINCNNLYIENSKYRIQKIINKSRNKDEKILNEICRSDSKGNLFAAILSIVVFVFVALIY